MNNLDSFLFHILLFLTCIRLVLTFILILLRLSASVILGYWASLETQGTRVETWLRSMNFLFLAEKSPAGYFLRNLKPEKMLLYHAAYKRPSNTLIPA